MASPSLELLAVPRLTRIIQALRDQRDIPGNFMFMNRTAVVPTDPNEIMIRFLGNAYVADIIEDDSKATIVSGRQYSMETNRVPNIKQGRAISQSLLKQLLLLQDEGQVATAGYVNEFLLQEEDYIRIGIMQRQETLLVAMALDGLNYDKFGVVINGISWGMPSDFKINVGIPWAANLTTATPITDIETLQEIALTKYGKLFNRMTMSYPAFRVLIQTTEFQNRAKPYISPYVTMQDYSIRDRAFNVGLVKSILGTIDEIEFYDNRYRYQRTDGTIYDERVWPINMISFSNSMDDNDSSIMRFAEGPVVESMVAGLGTATSVIGTFGAPAYGMISYATVPPDLNPPQVTLWGAVSGFPRKDQKECQACMNVGPITEVVTPGIPFPL